MSEKHKILFIINPVSGVGKKNIIPKLIEKKLAKTKFDWEIRYTEKRNHGAEIAQESKDYFDAIIAVGGDGSVNEIGSALINNDCALGILPCGSGNGLARHIKIPLKLGKAIDRIAAFNPIKIDTGLVNDRVFIGTCGFGFDAHIARKFDTFGKRGLLSYARLVIREFSTYNLPTFTVKSDSLNLEKKAILCSIANSSQFGNGFSISPNSDIQDGIFELVFLDKFGWLKVPGIARKFFSQKIHKSDNFSVYSFENSIQLSISNSSNAYFHIDGEPIAAEGEFNISIQPNSLKIL